MLVGDKVHMNFDRKESRDVAEAHRLFSPCVAIAARAQKCLWGTFRVACFHEWKSETWYTMESSKLGRKKVWWSCLNSLQWTVQRSHAKSSLSNYSLCPSLKTIHFHEEGLPDGSIAVFIFQVVALWGLLIIYIFLAVAKMCSTLCGHKCVCGSPA